MMGGGGVLQIPESNIVCFQEKRRCRRPASHQKPPGNIHSTALTKTQHTKKMPRLKHHSQPMLERDFPDLGTFAGWIQTHTHNKTQWVAPWHNTMASRLGGQRTCFLAPCLCMCCIYSRNFSPPFSPGLLLLLLHH